MQLALTKTMGIQKRLLRELDDTRIELENTRHELAKTRTYIEVQNEEQAELIQLVDELDNTLEDRDETIDNLTHAVKEIKSEQIGLYHPDNDYNHQEYHPPHYDMYHHGPMAFPYYSNYHQDNTYQTSSPELHQPLAPSTVAAPNPETRLTKGQDTDESNTMPTIPSLPQLADTSSKATEFIIAKSSKEKLIRYVPP